MNRKDIGIRLGIGIILILSLSLLCFPRIMSNGIGIVFTVDSDKFDEHNLQNSKIESLVIRGATYYLESNTVFQGLLNKIENMDTLGKNYNEWLKSVEKTKELIDKAIDTYSMLIEKAKEMPYNKNVMNSLASFDYDTYMIKNNLNPVVFSKIKEFMINGDIPGILNTSYSSFVEISRNLSVLRDELSQENKFDISIFLGINEKYSEASLFGSYVAKVFVALSGETIGGVQ